MSFISGFRLLRQHHPVLTYGGVLLLVIMVLLVAARLSITPLIRSGAVSWLHEHGVEASINAIELDISNGHFALLGVETKNANHDGARIGRLAFDWQWDPLADNHLVISQVTLDDFHIDALVYADGSMNLAGLALPLADAGPADSADQKTASASDAQAFRISLHKIQFEHLHACFRQFDKDSSATLDYCADLGGLDWNGNIDYTLNADTKAPVDDLPLDINGTLVIQDLRAHNHALSRDLLTIQEMVFSDAALTGLNTIALKQFDINGLDALQRANSGGIAPAHILSFATLNVADIRLQNMNTVMIDHITLVDTAVNLHKEKGGHFEFEQWFPPVHSVADSPAPGTRTKDNATVVNYALKQFDYRSSRPLGFVDDSLQEPFTFELPRMEMSLGPLDSQKPGALTHISLHAVTGRHAEFKLDTDINPLAAKPDMKGSGNISGLDLRALSPLTKQYIGHSIRSGQLDSDITLKADKGILDSKLSLTLNQFELRALNKKESEKLDSDLGIPLNSSLSLLRDSDNRIHLEIPVTGDINSPDFDPGDAIKTATSKAISTAVLYYYTPFGLVIAANTLFDLATALHFDPLVFDAGAHTLSDDAIKQLDTTANMLTERPGVHLTICGISNKDDVARIFPDVVKDADKTESKAFVLDDSKSATLLQLAERRGNAVKDYLVVKKKIDASRLILCEPEFQQDVNAPVVELSI